ncbi:LOB domain-containing protein 12-like [Malania oleifera]|uniref:LOB domain-containing protein 12-like n=1 Tax=Malania oleifera TaxID=397392 RepID=UPI0025AE1D1A|nr:LOB domain-containing protein 12-like [Malania oleifera]
MGGNSPCASCKLLRRRCAQDCIFAPYFPSHDPYKFAIVHKVFGASNVSKMLQELPEQQRVDAVSSLVYEANARMRDPVYGCVGAISYLQNQVSQLQMQLAVAQAEILCFQLQQEAAAAALPPQTPSPPHQLVPVQAATGSTVAAANENKLFLVQNNNNNLLPLPHHNYCFNVASNSSNGVIHESLKRDTLFGHPDMVS